MNGRYTWALSDYQRFGFGLSEIYVYIIRLERSLPNYNQLRGGIGIRLGKGKDVAYGTQ